MLHNKQTTNGKKKKTASQVGEYIWNHISDKGLMSKIYEECIQLSSTRNTQSDFKMGRETKYAFFQGDEQMANRFIKRCLTYW